MTSQPPATASEHLGFSELVFSDLLRTRDVRPTWIRVVQQCFVNPGMLASVILRIQQCAWNSGHPLTAKLMRTVGGLLVGSDFNPGMNIGRGLWLAHPNGVTIGFSLVIGDDVTLAGGVTAAARLRAGDGSDYATIGDGAIIGAHAVLVGNVRIGQNALVGANSVVMSDVPDNAVVMGNPARKIGERDVNDRV